MRRLAAFATPLLLVVATPAGAQEPGAAAAHSRLTGVPDVPPGDGTLRGRIVHATRPDAVGGLSVVLYALPPDRSPGLRGGVADERGEFQFEGISSDPATPYLVGVSFADVPFGTRVQFARGRTEREVVIEISDPSDDVSAAAVGEVRLRFERSCGGLRLAESHVLENPTGSVILVGEMAREGRAPVFETRLPPGATGFATASSQAGLEVGEERVRFWGPLHPGSQALEFSYALPVDTGRTEVRRGFASGASRVVVVTHARGPAVRSEGLQPEGAIDEGGRSWQTAALQRQAPGSEQVFAVELPAPEPSPEGLTLASTRMWLELDEAALKVDERYELEVAGTAPLRSRSDAPLLCVPLPDGAQELRFSTASLRMGLSHDPSGALTVHGPLPAGTSQLAISYLLPSGGGPLTLARRFPLPFPLLTLFVADTGLVAESPRLHRRRPVLADDRNYLHFEAFGIAADEVVPLSLRPLPRSRRASRPAVAGFLLLAALATLIVLAAPLRGRRSWTQAPSSAVALEREGVYSAIRDLDHDFETGKLSAEDYEAFRNELRARAVALLREERRETSPPEPAPDRCPECGATLGSDARFCSQCGAALRAAPGGERVRSA